MIVKNRVKGKRSFTPEQKEQYKQQKEAEKKDLYELYTKFLEKKTIKDFIGIIANYKQMHKYSLRNMCMVIAQSEQRQDNTKFVGILNSFLNWKKQDITILKGSKGYKVLVPIFYKKEKDADTRTEEKDEILRYFKVGIVFDVWQTSEYENYVKEQQEIDKVIMKNVEIDYTIALDFAKNNFPKLRIKEDFKKQEKKGSYDPLTKDIILYEKSSHTIFHELGHFVTVSVLEIAGHLRQDYAKNEVLAELFCYLLMKKFNENIKYNFAYSNCWAERIKDTFELSEFERNFKAITTYLEGNNNFTNYWFRYKVI